jgi:hypothetical protein
MNLATHLAALDAAESAPLTYRVSPSLIADAQAKLDAGEIPVKQRMAVSAAIRQAEEFPRLAMEFDAAGVLLRAVGIVTEGLEE